MQRVHLGAAAAAGAIADIAALVAWQLQNASGSLGYWVDDAASNAAALPEFWFLSSHLPRFCVSRRDTLVDGNCLRKLVRDVAFEQERPGRTNERMAMRRE